MTQRQGRGDDLIDDLVDRLDGDVVLLGEGLGGGSPGVAFGQRVEFGGHHRLGHVEQLGPQGLYAHCLLSSSIGIGSVTTVVGRRRRRVTRISQPTATPAGTTGATGNGAGHDRFQFGSATGVSRRAPVGNPVSSPTVQGDREEDLSADDLARRHDVPVLTTDRQRFGLGVWG